MQICIEEITQGMPPDSSPLNRAHCLFEPLFKANFLL